MKYKVIRIYRAEGSNRFQALEAFRSLSPEEQHGRLRDEFCAEDKPKGFAAVLKKQLFG